MFINMFEESCGILGKEKKTPLSSTTLGQFAPKKEKKTNFFLIYLKNNDHMVDVSMIIVL
jgi:hypothetical protein